MSYCQCLSVSLPSQKHRVDDLETNPNEALDAKRHFAIFLIEICRRLMLTYVANLAINMQLTQMFLFLHLFARFVRKS